MNMNGNTGDDDNKRPDSCKINTHPHTPARECTFNFTESESDKTAKGQSPVEHVSIDYHL